ncbi:MAG: hypothetical protein K0S95_654 [Pantoea eucrina]|jgi:uncharacterized protein YceH (UPF0502 family)|uniref:YceH family protein n=1 Tax=Pantoea sp. SIMBA_079 TaxID=3085817 RepID=UPI0026EF3659|nr:hypothetical protein [Pantoea eucrina]
MKIALSSQALRVLGALLEKQITTPEYYPLSLNGVVAACNQKSNREPVMTLSEEEVQTQLDELVKKHLVTASSGASQRVSKYAQRFCNSAFGHLQLSAAEVAVMTLLLLRGAQTPGELRTRSGRLYEFSDVNEVEQTLERLLSRTDGPVVAKMAREPGRRESRYRHLLAAEEATFSPAPAAGEAELSDRVAVLEQQVAELQIQLTQLLAQEP